MDREIMCRYSTLEENNDIDDLKPSVIAALKKISDQKGYTKPKLYKRTISTEGGNYLGILYEINIKDECTKESKETYLFVKHVLPPNDSLKFVSVSEVYSRELFVYCDLGKVFTKLQNEANIPPTDRFKMAQCFNDNSISDAIILENMAKKNFKTYGRMDFMSEKFAKLCVEQLAKLHGLSFVIERQMPTYYANKIKTLKPSLLFDEVFKAFASKKRDAVTKRLPSDLKVRIEKHWEKSIDTYIKYGQGNITSLKCLCHGDFKMNNIIFKEVEGEIKEVITVDYQLIHYGYPVIDFIFFVFIATDKNFRKKYLNELKDLYHDSLKKFLEYFDIDVNSVFSRKTFDKDFEDALIYGFVNSTTFLPFMFTKTDETPDLSKDDIMHIEFDVDERFYEIYQGIVEDFIDWGYL